MACRKISAVVVRLRYDGKTLAFASFAPKEGPMRQIVCRFVFLALAWLCGTQGAAVAQTPNARAWGGNFSGQLGNGQDAGIVNRNVPVPVSGLRWRRRGATVAA